MPYVLQPNGTWKFITEDGEELKTGEVRVTSGTQQDPDEQREEYYSELESAKQSAYDSGFDADAYVSDLSIAELRNLQAYGANLATKEERQAVRLATEQRLGELTANDPVSYGGGMSREDSGGTWDGTYSDGSSMYGEGFRGTNDLDPTRGMFEVVQEQASPASNTTANTTFTTTADKQLGAQLGVGPIENNIDPGMESLVAQDGTEDLEVLATTAEIDPLDRREDESFEDYVARLHQQQVDFNVAVRNGEAELGPWTTNPDGTYNSPLDSLGQAEAEAIQAEADRLGIKLQQDGLSYIGLSDKINQHLYGTGYKDAWTAPIPDGPAFRGPEGDKRKFQDIGMLIAGLGAGLAIPGFGLGWLGSGIASGGANAAAQQLITGDVDWGDAALAGATTAAGQYINESGIAENLFSDLGANNGNVDVIPGSGDFIPSNLSNPTGGDFVGSLGDYGSGLTPTQTALANALAASPNVSTSSQFVNPNDPNVIMNLSQDAAEMSATGAYSNIPSLIDVYGTISDRSDITQTNPLTGQEEVIGQEEAVAGTTPDEDEDGGGGGGGGNTTSGDSATSDTTSSDVNDDRYQYEGGGVWTDTVTGESIYGPGEEGDSATDEEMADRWNTGDYSWDEIDPVLTDYDELEVGAEEEELTTGAGLGSLIVSNNPSETPGVNTEGTQNGMGEQEGDATNDGSDDTDGNSGDSGTGDNGDTEGNDGSVDGDTGDGTGENGTGDGTDGDGEGNDGDGKGSERPITGASGGGGAEWDELFDYTKLTPSKAAELRNFIDYVKSLRSYQR